MISSRLRLCSNLKTLSLSMSPLQQRATTFLQDIRPMIVGRDSNHCSESLSPSLSLLPMKKVIPLDLQV